MLRNKEIVTYTIIALVITLAATVLCFLVDPAAGIICFLGCLGIFAVCVFFTRRRYRKIAALNAYLQKIASGAKLLDIRENTEGELSILKNEIYKAANALSEQASTLSQDKKDLADALSDISHQLKTPLTSLHIMTDLLSGDSLPPEKKSEFLDSMRAGLDRMEWLVLSLLKLARMDADAVTLRKESVSLSGLAEKSLVPMLIPLEIKNQTYSIHGEDAHILCDENWTLEALGNIVKNAVENAPEGGKIEISYGTNPLYSFITVHDNGRGIAKEDLAHLFKRFYRGREASRESVGIGLALSLAIMQKQNGDIDVATGSGSTFTLKFYHTAVVCHTADENDKTVTESVTGQSY